MARPADLRAGPRRTCVGCRRVRPQGDLTRVGRLPDGTLAVGRTLQGRGAWLCRASQECFELAARRGGFARAFRAPVRPPDLEALRLAWPGGTRDPRSDFVPGGPPARD